MCAQGQAPGPGVVREPLSDPKWSVAVLFLSQKCLYGVCMDGLLGVSLGIGNRKLEQ